MWMGRKRFEIRKNDREYSEGDKFISQEYDPIRMSFSGREIHGVITYFIGHQRWGLPGGICVFGCGDLHNVDAQERRTIGALPNDKNRQNDPQRGPRDVYL